MTPTEKHRETAEQITNDFRMIGDGCEGDLMEMIAHALAKAEREGVEAERNRCADIVERFAPGGDLYSEIFIDNDVATRVAIRGEILSEAGEG